MGWLKTKSGETQTVAQFYNDCMVEMIEDKDRKRSMYPSGS